MGIIIRAGSINANISPDAFHRWATHYLKCRKDFQSPHKFSPVPYFLLCRAIELEIKARHLRNSTQSKVKKSYGVGGEAGYRGEKINELLKRMI